MNAIPELVDMLNANTLPKAGDIYVATWGYDANIADFYRVIKSTKTTVTVEKLETVSLHTGNRYEEGDLVTAGDKVRTEKEWGDYDPELNTRPIIKETPIVFRRKLKPYWNGGYYFRDDNAFAKKWDGKPILEYNHH
jgi:hypothetical protein